VPGAQDDVAIGGGNRMADVHILPGVQDDAAVGRGQRRVHVDVAAATRNDIAIGGGNRGIDVEIAECIERQCRRIAGSCPCNRIIDVDVTIAGGHNTIDGHRTDHDIVGNQLGGKRCTGNISANSRDCEVGRVNQPGAGSA